MKKSFCRLMLLAVMLLAVCSEGFADVEINETNFPDVNFREYVKYNIDSNNDDVLDGAEIGITTSMDVSYKSISSLKGIEFLVKLTHLNCSHNKLSGLDVTQNTALKVLDCSSNQLVILYLDENWALEKIFCDNNRLKNLSLRRFSSSNETLRTLHCFNNRFHAVQLGNYFRALEELYCDFPV
ncbi:MAG: leucine-rich repeat domain-containing protein [Synergistaceae bacterium]|nr:leucine-rich repeat domain-containing protein [Synergistaceae bacterium]